MDCTIPGFLLRTDNLETKEPTQDLIRNVLLLGNSGVGKSTLISKRRSVGVGIDGPTQIADYHHEKRISRRYLVHFNIFDMSGNHLNADLSLGFIKDACTAVLLVFDLSNYNTFKEVQTFWMPRLEKRFEDLDVSMPTILLIGNKSDLPRDSGFKDGFLETYLREKNLVYHECCAIQSDKKDLKTIFDTMAEIEINKDRVKEDYSISVIEPEGEQVEVIPRGRFSLQKRKASERKSTCC